jgi:excinuclease ABC subunit A
LRALTADGFVRLRGAREHHPKSVDFDIPRYALVVFGGVSGIAVDPILTADERVRH